MAEEERKYHEEVCEREVYALTRDGTLRVGDNSPSSLPSLPTGAQDTGGDRGPSDPPLLSPALPQQRGRLLHLGAPGHHRPLAGRLGTKAGAAGEAVGE